MKNYIIFIFILLSCLFCKTTEYSYIVYGANIDNISYIINKTAEHYFWDVNYINNNFIEVKGENLLIKIEIVKIGNNHNLYFYIDNKNNHKDIITIICQLKHYRLSIFENI